VVQGRGDALVEDLLLVLPEIPPRVEVRAGLDLSHELRFRLAAAEPAEAGLLLAPVCRRQLRRQPGRERLRLLAEPRALAADPLERLGQVLQIDPDPLDLAPGQVEVSLQLRDALELDGVNIPRHGSRH
jgi:hypothetical protein